MNIKSGTNNNLFIFFEDFCEDFLGDILENNHIIKMNDNSSFYFLE